MPIVRRTRANIDKPKLLAELATRPRPSEEEIEAQAIAAGEQILIKSREAAAQEHARMLLDLKREVGHLVLQTTATVTGKILTQEDQRRMAEEAVKRRLVPRVGRETIRVLLLSHDLKPWREKNVVRGRTQ